MKETASALLFYKGALFDRQLFPQAPDMMTVQEAAKILRISVPALRGLIKTGQVEEIQICGKLLIPKGFLNEFIERSRQARCTKK